MHEDIVAVELLPKDAWVSPSSVVLLDEEGQNEDDGEKEEERENSVCHEHASFLCFIGAYPSQLCYESCPFANPLLACACFVLQCKPRTKLGILSCVPNSTTPEFHT